MVDTEQASVAAIVVSYNPDQRLTELIAAVSEQVGAVWLIDNGSEALEDDHFRMLRQACDGRLKIILNPENRGLAAAQNQGIRAALDAGHAWIMLLDHDSIPREGMVGLMLDAAKTYDPQGAIGFLVPCQETDTAGSTAPVYRFGRGPWFRRFWLKPGDIDDGLGFAMASGCLVPAARIREIGMMTEDFWIDYIDYDFSFRVLRAGYRIIGVGSARLRHRLGETHARDLAGRNVTYRSHPAFRRYTIYRNRIRVMRAHGARFSGFLVFEVLSIAKDLVRLVLLESDKASKCRAILRGIVDGVAGRGGFRKI